MKFQDAVTLFSIKKKKNKENWLQFRWRSESLTQTLQNTHAQSICIYVYICDIN